MTQRIGETLIRRKTGKHLAVVDVHIDSAKRCSVFPPPRDDTLFSRSTRDDGLSRVCSRGRDRAVQWLSRWWRWAPAREARGLKLLERLLASAKIHGSIQLPLEVCKRGYIVEIRLDVCLLRGMFIIYLNRSCFEGINRNLLYQIAIL